MPILVFLHGLLGAKEDWQEVRTLLSQKAIANIALDLPAHGEAKQLSVKNFEQCTEYLYHNIKQAIGEQDYILVGYSLGGRLALYYALQGEQGKKDPHLKGLILEGANFGLTTAEEKQIRWQNDQKWAGRFCGEDLANVLEDWYQQEVFAHLNANGRQALIQERGQNQGQCIGTMLAATSLAKQPYFGAEVKTRVQNAVPPFDYFYYFCGEQDLKFQKMIKNHQLASTLISNAGHNSHKESPVLFAEKLMAIMQKFS